MLERTKDEPLLELQDEDGLEKLDSQVQRAQEQLLTLKRQQEQIEKQKRELEELSKRQEQLTQGRTEMVEKFTRALVVLERESYAAQKRVEHLRSLQESYRQHLVILESINPKTWNNSEINKELNKALSAVDDARGEYSRSRATINPDAASDVLDPSKEKDGLSSFGAGPNDFLCWLRNGFAFTLPLIAFGVILLIVLFALFNR